MNEKDYIRCGMHLKPEYLAASLKTVDKRSGKDIIALCNKFKSMSKQKFFTSHLNFYIYGDGRIGKTWFLHALLKNVFDAYGENSIYFITSPVLYEYFMKNKMYDDTYTWVQVLAAKRVLAIDDLGLEYRGSNSGFIETHLEKLIRWRIDNGKITYIGSNADIDSLRQLYGKSFADLIVSECVVFDASESETVNIGKILLDDKLRNV